MPVQLNTSLLDAPLTFKCVLTLILSYMVSVIPYPANVVGLLVNEANDCAGTLCKAVSAFAPCADVAASVIPYPVRFVGLLVSEANDCAGTEVR